MKWFDKGWWEYLLEKPLTLKKFLCRISEHKSGPWYYNSTGSEPDMTCRNCGDNLG